MLTGIRDALVIYNPLAGRRRHHRLRDLEVARRILEQAGIETELLPTTGPGTATELALQAVAQARQLVIVCGGDGTINEAVNGLAGSQIPLAVLPAGTANVLAKELCIPWKIAAAAKLIPQGSLRRIALGVAFPSSSPTRQRYFLCVGGAGTDGAIIYSVNAAAKLRVGILAYWLEGFRQFVRYPFPEFRVLAPGRESLASLVVVGRTQHYGGPFRITTGASLFQDSFQLAVYTGCNRFRYLIYLPAVWLQLTRKMNDVHFWNATEVRCEPIGEQRIRAQVDGEPIGCLPTEFRIVPDALTLVVPEDVGKS
jgi:YegS/Rv2252/BmrU family lipid kinase